MALPMSCPCRLRRPLTPWVPPCGVAEALGFDDSPTAGSDGAGAGAGSGSGRGRSQQQAQAEPQFSQLEGFGEVEMAILMVRPVPAGGRVVQSCV